MKLSLLVVATALVILILAFQNASLFFIGYLWATILSPGSFIPWAMRFPLIFGCLSLVGYFFIDKSDRAPHPVVFYLAAALAVWVTLTTFWAVLPDLAWQKWNWAIESVLIVIATPLFLRTRAQIEAGFVCCFAALSAHVATAGVKTIFGTGGYDRLGRLMMTNFWLGETSTLALAAIITLPMAYYIARQSVLFEHLRGPRLEIAVLGYAFVAVMCVVGTSARTGVVTFFVYLLIGVDGIWRKAGVILLALLLYFGANFLLPEKSMERFGTIGTYQQDDSAEIRLGVWRWAISFAESHPLGGGFGSFYSSDVDYEVVDGNGKLVERHAGIKAPHSIYFEVLGEHGYPGLAIYLALVLAAVFGAWRISRAALAGTGAEWCVPFGRTLFVCLVLFLAGGAFIGVAFQPLVYIFLGFYCSVCGVMHKRLRVPSSLPISASTAKSSYG